MDMTDNAQRVSRFVHGVRGSYEKGCRCPKCRNAKRLASMQYKRKIYDAKARLENKRAW
jgi:hypothetical protein